MKKLVQITAVKGELNCAVHTKFKILTMLKVMEVEESKEGYENLIKHVRRIYRNLFGTDRISIQIL